jgi:hypothetical protein
MPQLHMGSNARMARLKEQSKPEKPVRKLPTTFTWTSGLNAILILDSSYNAVLGISNNPADIKMAVDMSGIEFYRTKTEIIAHCTPVGQYLTATFTVSASEKSHIIFLFPNSP